ncbi:MAG TPA: chitobiase/beta-hexosaminidase C-terminal domain-containing protein, partial [bacterium]|nr:chitobiase/beta-hexosaminidase C-terminal domain-containing protein [bacterium]
LSGNNNSGFYYTYTVVNTSIPVISYNSSAKPAGSYFNSTGLNLSLRFVDSSGLKDIWWNINQTDSSVDRRYLVTNSSSTDTTAIFNYPAAGDTLNWSLLAELSLHTLRFWVSNDGNAASDSYEFAFYKDVTNPVITLNDDSYTIKSDTVYFIGKSFNVDFSDNAGLDTIYINFNSNTEVLHSGGVSSFTENWNIPASIYHSLSRNANNRINLTAIDYAGNSSNSYINIRCETMILDGLTTDWQADEVIDTDLSEGDNVVFYFSWDDTAFYAGVDNIQLYSGVDNQHIIWLGFDATCNGSGGDSFTNPLDQAGRARFTGAFKPDYCFRFRNNLANEWEQSFVRWTGTGWDWTNAGDTVRTYLSWDASHKFTEIIIPRSIFGGNLLPSDKLGLCMWVVDPTGDGNNGWTWATLPVSNTEGASALQSDSIYFSSLYDTVSPLAPNIAPTVTIDTPVNCDTGGTVRFKWNFSDANPGNAQQYVNIEFCTTSVFTYPFASYSAATISTSYDSDLGNYRGEVYWRVKVSDGRDWSLWTAGTDSFIMTASINGNVEWNGLKHDTTALVPGQSYNYLYSNSVMTNQSCTVVLRSYKNDLTGVVCRVWWDAEYKYKLSKQFSSGNYDYWTAVLPGRGDTGNIYYRFECGDGGNTVYVSGNTKAGYTGNSINYGNWIVGDDQNNLNDFKYEITTLPKVIVSSPATENNGCDTSSTTVTVAGTNTAGCSVYLYLNGSLKTSDVDGNTNWSLSVSGLNANETNTISVLQYNPSVSIYSETSKIYVFCDTAGPVPSIISVMDMIDSTPAIDFPDFTDSFSIVLYEILLDTYSNFSNPDSYLSVSSNLTIPDTGWLTTEVWYIKVRAKDSLGNWGSYSNADSFAITLEDNQAPVITVNDDSYTVKSLNAALYGKLINIDFADNTGVETVYMSTGTNTETVLNSIGANYTTDWQIGSSIFQYLIRGNNKIYITAQDNYSNYSNAVINIAVETIAVSNGSISDFQSDELLETRLSNSFYFTWDDTSLYLGYAGPDGDLANADFFVYLQVSTASQSDSNRTTIDWGSYGTHTLPFGANYVLCAEDGDWAINRFQKNINGIWTEIGSSVNAEIFGGYTSNKTTKFRISWSSIGGKPEWMKVLAIHQYDGESKIHNSYPTGNPASGLTNVALTDYYYFNNLIDTVSPQTGKMINAEHNQNQNISGYNNNTMPYIYPYPVITHNDNVVLRVLTNKQSGGAANAYYTTDGSNPTTSSSNISLAWEADTGLVNSDVWAGYISPKSPGLTVKYFFKITQDTKTTTYLGSNGRKTSESEILPFS